MSLGEHHVLIAGRSALPLLARRLAQLQGERVLVLCECGPADRVPVLAVRADEAGEGQQPGVGEEFRDLADAADVLLPVGGREPEPEPPGPVLGGPAGLHQDLRPGVQPEPDVVPVQDVGRVPPIDARIAAMVAYLASIQSAEPPP